MLLFTLQLQSSQRSQEEIDHNISRILEMDRLAEQQERARNEQFYLLQRRNMYERMKTAIDANYIPLTENVLNDIDRYGAYSIGIPDHLNLNFQDFIAILIYAAQKNFQFFNLLINSQQFKKLTINQFTQFLLAAIQGNLENVIKELKQDERFNQMNSLDLDNVMTAAVNSPNNNILAILQRHPNQPTSALSNNDDIQLPLTRTSINKFLENQ